MTPTSIRVFAPSRLHFGLLRPSSAAFPVAGDEVRRFGGVGAMIDRPGIELWLRKADSFRCHGPLSQRVSEFAHRWAAFHSLSSPPPWSIEVASAPAEHVGLGVGTQLGLAVAAGLQLASGRGLVDVQQLAMSVNRGLRSAIGAYGFALGGLIVDAGKTSDEALSPLERRIPLPENWRFVLFRPRHSTGVSGAKERLAFSSLPPAPAETASLLRDTLYERLIPAADRACFDDFASAVQEYGRLAGMCFASWQGGPYHGREVTRCVEDLSRLGAQGVGQSSWGPTVFAVCRDTSDADRLSHAARQLWGEEVELLVAAPCNGGAVISTYGPQGTQSVRFSPL